MQSKLFDIFIQTIGMKRANGLGVFGFLKFKHASILVKTSYGLQVTGYRLQGTDAFEFGIRNEECGKWHVKAQADSMERVKENSV